MHKHYDVYKTFLGLLHNFDVLHVQQGQVYDKKEVEPTDALTSLARKAGPMKDGRIRQKDI
jgi:hypothetical protein